MMEDIYEARFDSATVEVKKELWKLLVQQFFQSYIGINTSAVYIGDGYFGEQTFVAGAKS